MEDGVVGATITFMRRGERTRYMSLKVVSSDSHVVEPPDLWADRLPVRFHDRAPRLERGAGGDVFHIGDVELPLFG